MKIAMLIDRFEVGGAETHTLTLAYELLRRGHEVLIYTNAVSRWNIAYLEQHAKFHYILWGKEKDALRDIGAFRPDVIHAHPFQSIRDGFDTSESLGVPFFITCHGRYPIGIDRSARGAERCTQVSQIIAVDLAAISYLEHSIACPEKMSMIFNGIDLEYFTPFANDAQFKTNLGLNPDWFTIVSVGRLGDGKQEPVAQLVESANRLACELRGLNLVIVGGGPYFTKIQQQSAEVVKDNKFIDLKLVGHQSDVRSYLAAADLVAACGRASLEAMACRRPVLLTFNSGFKEIFHPANYEEFLHRYRLYPSLDPVGLSQLLHQIARKEIALDDTVQACYELVRENHDIKNVTAQHEKLYESALRK